MSITTAPVPASPSKNRGWGCLGCGCLVLVLLLLLFVGLICATMYSGYQTLLSLTSTTPTTIPSFTGSDDLYESARQKLADFDHDVKDHQAATVRFSADEINSLLSHNPDMAKNQIQTFVSFKDSEARIQAAFPTDVISHGMMTGRYSSFDTTFELHFNPATKSMELIPHALQVADKTILGGDADNQQAAQSSVRAMTPFLDQQLNLAIRKNPDGATLLDTAKAIEVQNGQLVLITR